MKKAIVLAAGRGERMMPLTQNTPKPMLKISGKPMIEYTLSLLSKHGFKQVGLNLFYLGNQIKECFRDGSQLGLNLTYIEETQLTGTAGGAKRIAQKIKPKEAFFVISPDILINFDLSKIYNFHLSHGGVATICCYWRSKKKLVAKKSGLVVFDKKTKEITEFVERPQTEGEIISQWVNSSIYVFSPKVLEYVPDQIDGSSVVDFPKHIFPRLFQAKEKLFAYPVNHLKYYQLGIDTPDRIKKAEDDLKSGKFVPISS